MLNKNKLLMILFLLLITFLSIGGVSSNSMDNDTISNAGFVDNAILNETVLIDNALYVNNDNSSLNDDEAIVSSVDQNLSSDEKDNRSITDSKNLLLESNSSRMILSANNHVNILGDYQINSPIVNPSFDDDGTIPVGWDYSGAFITTNFINAKNGNRYLSISDKGHISQNINLDTIDSVIFWYMSSTKNSKIEVWLDNSIIESYTIKNEGIGKNKWEEVKLDLSKYNGYHTLKLIQYGETSYVDYFNINYNDNIVANFSIDSFSIVGDDITVNFHDYSQGFILNCLWDFGDGTSSNIQNPSHKFKLKHHKITLTVSNSKISKSYSLNLPVGFPKIERTGVEYFSIQEAINSAINGDVITISGHIFNSEFFENLVIDKSLTLNFNNCSLMGKSSNTLISLGNGAKVVVNNISLGRSNCVFICNGESSLTIVNSCISNVNLFFVGNMFINGNSFNNTNLTINNGNFLMSNCTISRGGVIVNGGRSKIINNVLSYCDVAIQQNGGELNIIHNIIKNNEVAINVTNGKSTINFNAIYSNVDFSLVFVGDVDFSNNWWASNEPSYISGLSVPSDYFDVYQAENIDKGFKSWLVLNFSHSSYLSLDYIIDAVVNDVECYNVSVDLTRNNLGESFDNLMPLVLDFTINNKYIKYIFVEKNKANLIFNWTTILNEVNLTLFGKDYVVPLVVDDSVPIITYITPSTIFDDEILVEIVCNNPNAFIIYTLDGTNPLNSSTRLIYNSPFKINESTTLHYTAISSNGNYARANYTWTGLQGIEWFIHETQYYDLTVTYLKKVELGDSGAIWSQYQNNNGVSIYNGSLTNISKWSNTNFVSAGSAVIDKEGHIYIGGDDGYLYCLNSQGLVIWRYGTTSKIICTPTIGYDGNIYFSNWMDSSLYCISPEGKLIWKYYMGDYNSGSSPIFGYDGVLYVLTTNDNNSCLFTFKNKKLLRTCSLPVIIGSTPSITSDGTLFMVSANHELVAVNWDGTLKYKFSLIRTDLYDIDDKLKEMHVSVTIGDDDTIYVINQPHYYYGVTPINWFFMRAYNFDGTLKWYTKSNDFVSGKPTYYGGVLYVTGNNNLIAINASSGIVLWRVPIVSSPYSLSSPLISGNEIIYVSQCNIVYAFNLSGVQLWNCTLFGKYGDPVSYSSPTLSNDGTLIVTTNQGIFAFNDVGADFMYKHVDGTELTFQFWECSTKGNNTYYWSFGDGVTSSEQNPIHTYSKAGKYKVILIVNHNGVNLVRNRTIEIDSYDITPPSDVSAFINNELTTGGIFSESQNITLSASDESGIVEIYYTIDGSSPINSETRKLYREKIIIEAYTVLKAVAFDSFGNKGQISSFIFNITDAINVKDKINSTLINKIQDLLDNAKTGSKFIFDYLELYGANFTINKPLNIITNNNTKLFGNGVQPVFTFTKSAKGSSLNGFVIENIDVNGILINNTSNISILNCIISANNSIGINIVKSIDTLIKYSTVVNSTDGIIINQSNKTLLNRVVISESYNNGIYILNSQGSVIANSTLNNNGKDWYNSKANQILLDNSMNTKLLSNEINYGFFGIHLINNNINLFIDNNKVYEGSGDAVLLMGRYSNINITHNILEGCFNGINFNGYNNNVNVERNLIWKMHSHPGEPKTFADYKYVYDGWNWQDTYGQYNNAIEISCYSQNFHRGVHIEDNICILTQHRAWEARHTHDHVEGGCIGYGYNLFDGSDSYSGVANGATYYVEGRVDLVVDRVGDSTYRLRLINRLDNHYLSEIPAFDVTFTAGGYIQKVKFVGGEALAVFDVASSINIITATISSYISKSVMWNIPISEGYNSSNRVNDPGFEKGEAIGDLHHSNSDSPNENNHHNSGKGTGAGKGSGAGSGAGDGKGSGAGHGGTSGTHDGASSGREGDVRGNANNLVKSDSGTSASVGVDAAAKGDDVSFEGGSDSGEDVNAYEINKSVDVNKNMVYIAPFILFIVLVLVVVGYKRRKDDGY